MVRVYAQKNCMSCAMTHKKLDQLGIPFESIDVGEDHDARDYVLSLGALETPVVVVGTDWWTGYRPHRLEAL